MTSTFRTTCLLAPFFVLVGGCEQEGAGDATADVRARTPALPDSVFEHVETIVLEENDEVVNVSPDVTVQADGSFLIADGSEGRVRIYDRRGNLLTQFGRRGDGPGELGLPVTAMRRPDGSLLVVDFSRGLLGFDSSGTRFVGRSQPPIRPVYAVKPLSDAEFLVAGLRHDSRDPRRLLHAWDAEENAISFSFFPTPGDSLARLAARNFGWADFARHGDTIAAIAAFSDTVYLFDRASYEPLGQVPLPITDFKRMTSYDPAAGPAEMDEWLEGLNLLTSIHWLEDRTLLVEYQQPRGGESEWNLLRTTLDGRPHFDLRNTPELLAADGNLLFFVHPESPTPNMWAVARLR